MSVALKGIGKFDAAVKAWFASVETASAAVAVGLARRVFDKVLIEPPQYSGDFAANWKVTIDAPASDFNADAVDKKRRGYPDATGIHEFTPFKRGDPEAIAYAKERKTFGKPIAEHQAVRFREGDQQDADAEHQPGLVGIPEGADRRDHHVLLGGRGPVHQHAHAQVITVADHVDKHRDAHQHHEDD